MRRVDIFDNGEVSLIEDRKYMRISVEPDNRKLDRSVIVKDEEFAELAKYDPKGIRFNAAKGKFEVDENKKRTKPDTIKNMRGGRNGVDRT